MRKGCAAAMLWAAVMWPVGCNGKDETTPTDGVDTDPPTDTDQVDTTGDTGDPPTGEPGLWATCVPHKDNALRFWCDIIVDPPQPVELAFRKSDGTGPERVHASLAPARTHRVGMYLMGGDSDYDFAITAPLSVASGEPYAPVTGTVRTGVPPLGARVALSGQGTPSIDKVGFSSPCADGAFIVIMDTVAEQVLWYEDVSITFLGFIDGVSFTEDGTLLTVVDSAVIELDPMGQRLMDLYPGADLPNRAHHDVFRKNGLTYVLFQETVTIAGEQYLLDGFYIFDSAGSRVGEWHLADYFTPVTHNGSLFADDYSHANAIWVDDDNQILFSMRHLSAIASIEGDLASPEFGALRWRLSHPDSDFGSDFTIETAVGGPANFEQQHNAYFLDDGRLTLLDNRIGNDIDSRVLDIVLDHGSQTATIVEAYDLPEHCDFQGGAWRTPTGNPLATCAPSRSWYEFVENTPTVAWDGVASCLAGFGTYVPRFVPVDW